ncbi:MAG: glycine--tRNA ligase subunit beta [Betaproteobacteria bacterium]|nr:MAG: glycine--tRNA ligase subunit beta [Betaproteobacteria bacterium]
MAETLVVELLTEELPPKALRRLGDAFASAIAGGLREQGFLGPSSHVTPYATPRRLAVSISDVRAEAEDKEVIEKLMPVAAAKDASGNVSQALLKRLEKLGRQHLAGHYPDAWDGPDHLYVQSDGKGEYVWLRSLAKGEGLFAGLEAALNDAIGKLPIPKVMSYQRADGATFKFVRPVHRLIALHGAEIVPVSALGLTAGRATLGHRFLAKAPIDIANAESYVPALAAEGKVIASFAERRARIVGGLEQAAGGGSVIMPDELLDEVTALVEWPKVYAGGFDAAFLAVPQECLILTMQRNQRYFALADPRGKLQNRFLMVSNTELRDPAPVIHGNERVLRARLADAKFFYDQDRKIKLELRVPRLASVVYHNKLGSQIDRVKRLEKLAGQIAGLYDPEHSDGLIQLCKRAAYLSKADLVTEMVGEFPELQGIMGRYYALHDGEDPLVADAIAEHYRPRFSGDTLPARDPAIILALADKLLTLSEMFGIGNAPTGDKDPFGLRRAALEKLVRLAFDAVADVPAIERKVDEVMSFVFDRLRALLRERGHSANHVEAVLSMRPDRIDTLPAQMEAIRVFVTLPEAEALASANKRIGNILRKSESAGRTAVDHSLLAEGAEQDLYSTVQNMVPLVSSHVRRGDYTEALRALASARAPVDRFFDDVLVMADDPAVRANRLALLRALAEAMNQVADISKLAV